MTISSDVSQMRGRIKHAPDTVDLDEVRELLGRVEDALEVLISITNGADARFYYSSESEAWNVILDADVDDRRLIMRWMAGDI